MIDAIRACAAVVVCLAAGGAVGGPSDVFEVEGQTAKLGWVTAGEGEVDAIRAASPMLRALDGVLAELDAAGVRDLRRSARKAADTGGGGEREWVVQLENGDGARASVEIVRDGDTWVARTPGESPEAAELHERWFAPASMMWKPAARPLGEALPVGEIVDLPKPYFEGQVLLTQLVMRDRFGAGRGEGAEALSGVTRVLDEELMWVRLPRGYDPAVASGVIVWCSPSEQWRIPEEFHAALDDLNLIACGFDNAGNFRRTRDGKTHGIVDRLQLMLDAVQTCRVRFNVDDERVYMTGFSGGGRVSSIMVMGFPEVFRGAVPIVGLDSYKPAAVEGNKYVPARLPKPQGERWKLLRERRIWALTGSEDFNREEMESRVKGLVEDGLQVKLHTTPGMPHEKMPAEATVREALRWVDEPAREAQAAGVEKGQELWERYVEEFGEREPTSDEAVRALVEITAVAPWSEAAWRAAGLLGYERPVSP